MPTSRPDAPGTHDRDVKRARVLAILDARGADRLWLSSHTAVSWYLDGARTHTSLLGDPIVAVEITRDGERAIVYANEADRLVAEELPSGIPVTTVGWQGALTSERHESCLRESDVAAELRAARATLLPAEMARFRALGRETAAVVSRVLRASSPAHSEVQLAARLSAAITELGADPAVVMVAGSERLGHRHPLPTNQPLGDRTMIVVCARRHGLITNLTRWVRHTPTSAHDDDRDAAIRAVEADYFAATRVGRTLADVLADGSASYARYGFAADEATKHHQGGAAGYAGRDPRATATALDVVQRNQAFTWNPTAPGRKIEDTVLLTDMGFEVLTHDPGWPTVAVAGLARPTELVLP